MSHKQHDEYLEQMRELEEEHLETVAKEELWWEQKGWRDAWKRLDDEAKELKREICK